MILLIVAVVTMHDINDDDDDGDEDANFDDHDNDGDNQSYCTSKKTIKLSACWKIKA